MAKVLHSVLAAHLECLSVMRNRHPRRSPSGSNITSDRSALAIRAVRRKIATSLSLALLVLAAIVFPVALLGWANGFVVPALICLGALGLGAAALASAKNGHTGHAVLFQAGYIAASGLVLSILDPSLVDLGLGLIALAFVHVALFLGAQTTRNNFVLLAGLTFFASISAVSLYHLSLDALGPLEFTALINTISVALAQAGFSLHLRRVATLYRTSHDNTMQHLLEHMGDGYARLGRGGALLFLSRAAENTLGVREYELAGEGLAQRVHISDRPVFLKGISDALHSGQTKAIEVRVRKDKIEHPAGPPEFSWIEFFLSPLPNSGSKQAEPELVALLRDITSRKCQEEEMSAARQAAEEASLTKSRFLATIGHELRTPLNAIVGFSEMMSNGIGGKLDAVHQDYAQLIQQSGHHLLGVVNMLLNMSRIEAGKFELQLAEFDPASLVDPCLRMVENSASERNITFVSNIATPLPPLRGDERACRQILINLLSNAVKFSKNDSEVSVSIRRQGQNVALSVTDSGIGMSSENASRIGEPFFQAHGDLNRHYEGTGLGLSIVKGLVELHGGKLQVNSKLHQGTRVTVFLPIHGPQTDTTSDNKIANLRPASSKTEPDTWPEQKRIAQ